MIWPFKLFHSSFFIPTCDPYKYFWNENKLYVSFHRYYSDPLSKTICIDVIESQGYQFCKSVWSSLYFWSVIIATIVIQPWHKSKKNKHYFEFLNPTIYYKYYKFSCMIVFINIFGTWRLRFAIISLVSASIDGYWKW